MTDNEKKQLAADTDGLKAYEYIANHIDGDIEDIDLAITHMEKSDLTGQFLASASRYLHAIDADKFAPQIERLVAATIERDREHKYLADVLQGVYGPDYRLRAPELIASDNNFRRIYKRLYPAAPI